MLKPIVPEIASRAQKPLFPTQAHRKAHEVLLTYAEHYFARAKLNPAAGPLKCRHNRLISGPSGAGKSHLAGMLARATGAHLVEINYGDWIPVGSSTKPCSLVQIAMALVEYERVILLVDEIDKLVSENLQSTWSVCCQNELYSLLERSLPIRSMYKEFKDQELPGDFGDCLEILTKAVQKNLFMVACGTWQEARSVKPKWANRSVGFDQACGTDPFPEPKFSTREAIQSQGLIPEELRNRFHGEVIELRYPDKEETQLLIERLGIAELACKVGRLDLVESLDLSHGGMRELESLYTDLLIAADHRLGAPDPAAEKPCTRRQYPKSDVTEIEADPEVGFLF
jgi:adenylate kinase family enzyme